MKKKIKIFFCMLGISSMVLFVTPSIAGENTVISTEAGSDTSIQPRTDIKEWRYKIENGNLYKRLYNYTRNRWETDWIFVMSGVIEP